MDNPAIYFDTDHKPVRRSNVHTLHSPRTVSGPAIVADEWVGLLLVTNNIDIAAINEFTLKHLARRAIVGMSEGQESAAFDMRLQDSPATLALSVALTSNGNYLVTIREDDTGPDGRDLDNWPDYGPDTPRMEA